MIQIFLNEFFNKIIQGITRDGLKQYNWEDFNKTKGVLCSNNFDNKTFSTSTIYDKDYVEITCETVVQNNDLFNTAGGETVLNLKCPPRCQDALLDISVYEIDHRISICGAAISKRVIQQSIGGLLEINVQEGQNSFSVRKYNKICPQNFNNKNFFKTYSFIEKKVEQMKSFMDLTFKQDDAQETTETDNQSTEADSQSVEGEDSQSTSDQPSGEGATSVGGSSVIDQIKDTKKGLELVQKKLEPDQNEIKDQLKLIQDSVQLLQKVKKDSAEINHGQFGPETLTSRSQKGIIGGQCIEMKQAKDLKKMGDLKNIHLMKLQNITNYEQILRKEESISLNNRELYDKTYQITSQQTQVEQQFTLFTDPVLQNHETAISCQQKEKIKELQNEKNSFLQLQFIDDQDSKYNKYNFQYLVLKNKFICDGIITVQFMALQNSKFGIAFRFIDQFNHYRVDFQGGSEQQEGYIQMTKIVNGVQTLISKQQNGGFLPKRWYDVKISFDHDKFQLFMNEEGQMEELVLETGDIQLKCGSGALISMSKYDTYFDQFRIQSEKCHQFNNPVTKQYVPKTCSRYSESYSTSYDMMWHIQDPIDQLQGPSDWKYSLLNDLPIIKQDSQIKSLSDDMIGSFSVMRSNSIVCNEGSIEVEFKADQQGYVGLSFRYKNTQNYYLFEIHARKYDRQDEESDSDMEHVDDSDSYSDDDEHRDEKKYKSDGGICILKQMHEGIYNIIQKNRMCSYTPGLWHRLSLTMSQDNEIIVELGNNKINDREVFRKVMEWPQFSGDKVALVTWNTTAMFRELQMHPNLKIIEKSIQQEIKQVEFKSGCEQINTVRQIKKFCRSEYQFNIAQEQQCEKNFCPVCCAKRDQGFEKECLFKCQGNKIISRPLEKTHDQCIKPNTAMKNMYNHCYQLFGKSEEQLDRCFKDSCDLCCSLGFNKFDGISWASSQLQDIDQIENCHYKCLKNYQNHLSIQSLDIKFEN